MDPRTSEPQKRRRSRADRFSARRARTRSRFTRTLMVLSALAIVFVVAIAIALVFLAPKPASAPGKKAVAGSAKPKRSSESSKAAAARKKAAPVVEAGSAVATATSDAPAAGVPDAVAKAALAYPDTPSVTPRSYAQLSPKHRYIAITLDDGLPFDERILKLFEDNNIRCTTFLLGSVASSRPDIVKRLDRDGFEIANHTWDHDWLTHSSDSEIRSQLSRTQKAISKVTGNQAPYLRPPYGATDSHIKELAAEQGYKIVMWSRSFGDTGKHARPSLCYQNAIKGIKPGDIVLCHWGRPATYQAMVWFLRDLKKMNLTPVTVSELIADSK